MQILLMLIVLLLVPVTTLAQAPSKAGVVTTLEGSVTARRVALPDPVPLKFKDDVFLQDTVTTGDKALARMLLGGKAVVTVRERSVLTITEVPGRSTIELENGKFSLAVARERMRPGEEIQIRTPNAIAGVRGTVVIAEVRRQELQRSGVPTVVSYLYVLRGAITAQRLDPSTGLPAGAPLSIGTMQAYSVAGGAPPRVDPIPPEQVSQITSGLQPTGPKGGGEAGQEQVKSQAIQTALGLLGALTGNPTDSALGQAIVAGPVTATLVDTTSTTTSTTPPPIIPPISEALASEEIQALIDAINLAIEITGSLSLPPGTSLKKFTGTTVSKATVPLLTLSNANISQDGSDDLIRGNADASVIVAGPLARVIDSILRTGGSFFGIDAATLVSSTKEPFISFDPVILTTGDSFVSLVGGTVTLAGALFQDEGGTLTLGGNLLRVENATLMGTGAGALFQLAGTTVTGTATPTRSALFFDGGGLPVHLAGALLTATGSTFTGWANFLFVGDGAVSSSSGDPFLRLTSSTVNGTANFVHVDGLTQGTAPTSLSLAGPLARVIDSILTTGGSFFGIDAATVVSSTTQPFIHFDPVTLTTGDSFASIVGGALTLAGALFQDEGGTLTLGGNLLRVENTTLTGAGTDALLQLAGTTVTGTATPSRSLLFFDGGGLPAQLAGALLTATGSTFTSWANFLFVGDGAVSSSSSDPFLRLTASTVSGAGNFVHVNGFAQGTSPTSLSLAGPLAKVVNSTITTGGAFLGIEAATVTSSTAQPFITLDNTTVTADRLLGIELGGTLTLAGSLLADTNGSLSTGSVLSMAAGGQLTGTTTSPLVSLSGTTLTASTNVVSVTGAGTRLSVAGPLLKLVNASATTGSRTNVVSNGGFESGLTQWTVFNQTGSSGDFFLQSGTLSPVSLSSVPAPLAGTFAAMSDQGGPGVHILLRDVTVPANAPILRFALFIGNRATEFAAPTSITLPNFNVASPGSGSANQQVRVDILSPAAGAQDVGGGVLRTIFQTQPGQVLVAPGYQLFSIDLSDFAGQTVRLRFTEVDNENFFQLGVDEVALASEFNVLRVDQGSLVSTATEPLLSLGGSTLVAAGDLVFLTRGASLSTAGPLLRASDSTLTSMNVLGVFNGSTLTSTSASPLIQLNGSTLTAGSSVTNGGILEINETGAPASTRATVNLNGPLLSSSSDSLTMSGPLFGAFNGGTATESHPTSPFVSITGGTHTIATNPGTALFQLGGRTSATLSEIDDGVTLTVGTDQPLSRSGTGAFMQVTGATISTRQGFAVDHALLAATAPLLDLRSGSTLTTSVNALDLVQKAKLTSVGPVFKLDASTLTVTSGALALVGNGSFLRVTGDFLQLSNASTLNLLNGPVLNVTGNSVVNISGALVNFVGAGGNAINVNNSLCGGSCASIGGLNVKLLGGATEANVSITNPIKNGALGAINVGANAAVINVSGVNSKVTISGN